MRKAIAVVLATTIAVSVAMIGCSKSKNNEVTTTKTVDGLKNNEDTFSIEEETVTDKNGEAVTLFHLLPNLVIKKPYQLPTKRVTK